MSVSAAPWSRARPPDGAVTFRSRRWRSNRPIDRIQGWTDGRTREARFLRRYTEVLLRQLDREPSPVELALVRRSARLALRLELLDTQLMAGQDDGDPRAYLALNAQFIRCMKTLGLRKAAQPRAGLPGYLTAKARNGSDGA